MELIFQRNGQAVEWTGGFASPGKVFILFSGTIEGRGEEDLEQAVCLVVECRR